MPTNQEIERLKKIVKRGLREPDQWVNENDVVTIPRNGGDKYWRSLRVKLVSYAYGQGDEGSDDEPEFITAVSADGSKKLVHEPQVVDPPEVEKDTRVLPDRKMFLHESLDDKQVHEFFISTSAFDSDSDTAWHGVVQALQSDLRNVGSAAIGSSLLAGFQSPTALMNFVIQHAGDAATDDPEQIGSQEIVLDVRQVFKRPENKTSWTIHKWTLFSRSGQKAWYLALWRIELDARAGALASTSLDQRDNATDVGRLRESLQVERTELAAVRTLQGEIPIQVAESLGLQESDVRIAVRNFMDQDADEIYKRLSVVSLAENKFLRDKISS